MRMFVYGPSCMETGEDYAGVEHSCSGGVLDANPGLATAFESFSR